MFKFMHDLAPINNLDEFKQVYHEIQPPELKLKRKLKHFLASLLDMYIKTVNENVFLSPFDKKDFFPFSIIKITYLYSNMRSKNASINTPLKKQIRNSRETESELYIQINQYQIRNPKLQIFLTIYNKVKEHKSSKNFQDVINVLTT